MIDWDFIVLSQETTETLQTIAMILLIYAVLGVARMRE